MAWTTEWTGLNRWKVIYVDTTKLVTGDEIKKDDYLTFEGSGDATMPPSVVKRDRAGTVEAWADSCQHYPKALPKPELVTLNSHSLGPGHVTYSTTGFPKPRLNFMKGGPSGAVWTAEDQT